MDKCQSDQATALSTCMSLYSIFSYVILSLEVMRLTTYTIFRLYWCGGILVGELMHNELVNEKFLRCEFRWESLGIPCL